MSEQERITEAWDWIEHDDGLHHMSRSKHGKWCEIQHAQAVIAARDKRIAELEALAFAVGQCYRIDVPDRVYEAWSEPANYRESELVRLRDARDAAEDAAAKLERQLAGANQAGLDMCGHWIRIATALGLPPDASGEEVEGRVKAVVAAMQSLSRLWPAKYWGTLSGICQHHAIVDQLANLTIGDEL